MIKEFPYKGKFERTTTDKFGAEILGEEIFSGDVDIQHTSIEMGVVAQNADYAIFTDMPKDNGKFYNPIRRDDWFTGEMYGETITGRVRNVQPSQLGKLTAYINRGTWGE